MRLPIRVLAVALVGATTLVAPPAVAQQETRPEPGWGKGLDYDLDAVRAAQKRAAESVGAMPAHLQEYFKDKPAFAFHDRRGDHAKHERPVVLHTTPENYPAMQAQLQRYLATRYRAQAAAAAQAGEPMVFKVPTLLFQVNNTPFRQGATAKKFEDVMSGVGTSPTGTVTEMYLEQSFGNMVVDFDAFGPYTVSASNTPATDCHYGTEGAPVTGSVLGLGGLGAKGMAAEVVPQADPAVDFGEYDNDLDGIVDFLLIVHSGPDAAATGDPCHVWSHYFGPVAVEQIPTTDRNAEGEPVGVSPTMTVPEVDLGIGVVAHELMHALGEPDYYGTAGTVGTGDWDLGAGGSWSGVPAQSNPVHFNPVMKVNFGWITPKRIDTTTLDQALRPRANHPDLLMVPLKTAKRGSDAAKLCNQAPVGVPGQNRNFYTAEGDCLVEGYLIENVNRASAPFGDDDCTADAADFDRQMYGSGLMVWHWDFTNYESLGNDNVLRPMLDIEEFDRRDPTQDLATGVTRAQPLDPFWGDPVGMTGATQIAPRTLDIAPPAGSPWTVTGVPTTVANQPATPQPTWEAPAAPPNTGIVVALEWENENDDWDLFVDRRVDGRWVRVGSSAKGAPQTSEQVLVPRFAKGEEYRARAVNWLATGMQAKLSVAYTSATATMFGPAGTRTNDLEQTGWAFTNLRPFAYRGMAHAAEQPKTDIVLDLVRHDGDTVDVSGDFVRPVQPSPAPVVAGAETTFTTVAYNHGGKRTPARVQVYDGDPARGGRRITQQDVELGGFARTPVTFRHTPDLGIGELYVRVTAPGDTTPGNDVVRSEIRAHPGGGDVLVVDNDFGWTHEQAYEAALRSLGVRYDVVEGEPDVRTLRRYAAVVWVTTTVSGRQGVLSTRGADELTRYLEADGKVWLASTRAGSYLGADWMGRYFGFEPAGNLLNSMGAWLGTGDSIGGNREIALGYLDGRPYLDFGALAEDPDGEATAVLTHSARPKTDTFATKVVGDSGFRTVYGVVLGLVRDGAERVRLAREVLSFLDVPLGAAAEPTELTVHTERFQHVQPGADWPVTVGAFGPGLRGVQFVFRPYGGGDWTTLPLTEVAAGIYTGTVPGAAIGNQGLEYYVEVAGKGNRSAVVDGGPDLPNVASAPYGDPVAAACASGNPSGRKG